MDIEENEDDVLVDDKTVIDEIDNDVSVVDDDGEQEIITIGEPDESLLAEEQEEDLPKIKKWRQEFKETARRNRELEAELQALKAPIQHQGTQSSVQVEKPTLEGCDYDVELFESNLLQWNDAERKKRDQQIEQQRQYEKQQSEWATRVTGYEQAKATLKVSDFDESEEEVIKNLNVNQQGLILKYAKEAHKIIYALGKAPAKLKELSAIVDPIAFALTLADIEREIRVTKRSNIKPEERIESSVGTVINKDAKFEKLMETAMKTNNYTEVAKYRRTMKK